jgi:hypothetical protein
MREEKKGIREGMFLARLATVVEIFLDEQDKDKQWLNSKYNEIISYYETGVHPKDKKIKGIFGSDNE